MQVIRDRKKINAGAQFLQTNLVFDPDMLDPWLECLDNEGLLDKVYILVGICPLKSMNLARYLNDNIPGVTIPDAVMKRLAGAGDRFREESIAITVETVKRLQEKRGVSGVHLMPLGWEAAIPQIMEKTL